MMWLSFLVGAVTGLLSGCGIGGGSLLMLYLTNWGGVQQAMAGGINLLYFLFCAPAALVSHIKNKLVDGKAVLWCSAAGIPATLAASFWATAVDTQLLRRGFGVLLLYIGFHELLSKSDKTEKNNGNPLPKQ